MDNCVFCKIVEGQIPADRIYESDRLIAILDAHPVNPGHLLLLSKKHYQTIDEAEAEVLSEIGSALNELGKRLKTRLGVTGYNICYNNGQVAGQVVPHLHFHIIPRHPDDNLKLWVGKEYEEGEAAKILNLLK